eukprot:gene10018-8887_t
MVQGPHRGLPTGPGGDPPPASLAPLGGDSCARVQRAVVDLSPCGYEPEPSPFN